MGYLARPDAKPVPTMWTPLSAAGAGALVGALVGLTGVGGGSLMTPILLVAFQLDPVVAIGTDLLFAATTKVASAAVHHRGKHVDWRIVRLLWLGSLPLCLLVGAKVAQAVDPEARRAMVHLLGWLIAVSGLSMLLGPKIQTRRTAFRLADPVRFKRWQAPSTVAAGALLGGVISATSIGAGAIGAVLLRALYPLRMTPIRLVATDTVFAIPVALVAGAAFASHGRTDWQLLAWLLLGSVPSAIVASHLAAGMRATWLRTLLGAALVTIAIKLIVG